MFDKLDRLFSLDFAGFRVQLLQTVYKLEFWLLTTWACLIAINLSLVGRLAESPDDLAIQSLTWVVAVFLAIRQFNRQHLSSSVGAIATGTILVVWALIKSLLTQRISDILFIMTPLSATLGIILIGAGWRGGKIFWQPIVLAATLGIPVTFLFTGIEKFIPVNVLTAQFANSVLWYSGAKVVQNGITIVSQFGSVEVARGCAGLPPILMLLRITLMFVFVFPVKRIHMWIMFLSAVAIAFVVNALRVTLLVIIASQPNEVFKYWHDGDGSQIFSVIAVSILLWLCNWLSQDDDNEGEMEMD
ncbi:MAG: cyanoexosortase A [Pseudanabaenaceae cyanobacterium bins.39]|nr:cyanoexosortase A [Pseudanabaenaceae cyanobacterium bins.39]